MEIPGFEQCEKIAESGFASYWKAYQSSLDRHVTLVVLRPDAVSDEKARRSFLRDIRIVAGLKHPSLFQIYDVMEMDATLVVTVEHLSGHTLRQYVRQRGHVKADKALTIARWLAEGLSHVYEKTGLVHLALTPDQIWINTNGEVKILGFGFSNIFEQIGYSAADVPFLSPEQVQHQKPYDFPSDIYSVGSILYYMLAGRVPFEGNSSEQMLELIVSGQLPSPSGAGITTALQQLLVRMLMKAPDQRYPGWLPAMQDMDKVLDGAKFLSNARKSGMSTILVSPGIRSSAPAAAGTPAVPSAPPAVSSASLATTFMFLLVVVAFLGWMGYLLWRMPPPVPPPPRQEVVESPAVLDTRNPATDEKSPAARVRVIRRPGARVSLSEESLDTPAAAASSDTNASAAESPAVAPAASNAAPAEVETPPEAPPEPAKPAVQLSAFDKLADDVVRGLAAGRPDQALAAVDAAVKEDRADVRGVRLDELRRLTARCGEPAALALAALRQQVGQKAKLPVNGRVAEVTINRIEGQTAVVSESVLSENVSVKKSYTLEPARMGPADQVRVIAVGTGPEFAVARLQLYLKNGARDRAAAVAPETGPLAPAFQRFFAGTPP